MLDSIYSYSRAVVDGSVILFDIIRLYNTDYN